MEMWSKNEVQKSECAPKLITIGHQGYISMNSEYY